MIKTLLIATALLSGVSTLAMAQPNQQPTAAEIAQNNTDAQAVIAAAPEARRALISALLANNPSRALGLMAAIKAASPSVAAAVYADIVAVLGGDTANDALVQQLADANPDLVADVVDNVEPAAGDAPQSSPLSFNTEEAVQETQTNAQETSEAQVNPASPSAPAI